MAPSPTADATRFIESRRTSPAAKTPGTLVSRGYGGRSGSGHRSPSAEPVMMNPWSSRATVSPSEGEWRVELRARDGQLLHVERFTVR